MTNLPPKSDIIIFNAQLYDPLTGFQNQSAVWISDGIIQKTGNDVDILGFRQKETVAIDARRKILLPAFTDAHTHFFEYVKRRLQVDLGNCRSLEEALEKIQKYVRSKPAGEWITGGGWNRNLWGDNDIPTRQHLDAISTNHYIALDSKDWHTCWVNTPVLDLAGIDPRKAYPGARHLAIHPQTGEFTGILEENVRLAVYDLMPAWNYQRLRKDYFEVLQEFYRFGFGSIHTVETLAELEILQEACHKDELGLRTFCYLPVKDLEIVHDLANRQDPAEFFLRVSGVKLFVDGSFGSQTAELFENYQTLNHSGVENMTEKELDRLVSSAVRANLSCAVHAIGDRAIQKTLRVFGKHYSESLQRKLRHRIEHAQLIRPEDIALFAEYGVSASVQPVHLAADVEIIKKYLGDREKFVYPYHSLLKSGARLIFGSDMPIENFNPWYAIYTAMERRYLMEPSSARFRPEQCLDLSSSIMAYTANTAAVVGLENVLGRIVPGMKADVFLADRDLFKTDVEELKETVSVLTVVDGNIVHNDMAI